MTTGCLHVIKELSKDDLMRRCGFRYQCIKCYRLLKIASGIKQVLA